MKRMLMVLSAGALAAFALGCEPQAQRAPVWTNPLPPAEASLPADPNDPGYVLARMEFGRMAMLLGAYDRAEPRLKEAFDQFEVEHENVAAAMSSERYKYYKGETYERAMLCTYLGILAYLDGNYNDSRILLTRALTADRAAVVNEKTPAEVGEDFGLAYYWLGRTYAKLGDAGNSAIAFRKATTPTPRKESDAQREQRDDAKAAEKFQKDSAEGEAWTYQTFTDPKKPELAVEGIVNLAEAATDLESAPACLPDAAKESPVLRAAETAGEFFAPAFQDSCNLVLTVEVGRCPYKYLGGISGEKTEFGRSLILPHAVRVYVDGHYAAPAMGVLDLWQQAATQDRIAEKEAAQTTKAVLREVLSYAPYAGSAASHWDVSGDVRHWTMLPGRIYIFAAQVAPGPHTVRLEMYDAGGRALPRWTTTYYGLAAPERGEACIFLEPRYDGDNRLPAEDVQKAIGAGANPAAACMY